MMAVLGDILLVIGAAFLFLGSLGLTRMPDLFNRIHATTKAGTLGALGVLAGIGCHHPQWAAKLVLIGLFVLITSPVGSSVLARAALSTGITPFRKARPAPTGTETETGS